MGGGIIQLVSTGIPDLYLTGDPQITWFKVLYRRYTEFSMADVAINIKSNLQFGDTSYINIGNIADKLNKITLIADIPTPEFTIKPPTVRTIKKLLNEYNIDYTTINGLPQDDNICISYETLFGKNNDGPLSLYLINNTFVYNFIYNIKLDILDYYVNLYDLVDDKHIGKYIAIKADNISFNSYGNNIDPEGYLLLTDNATRDIINISDNNLVVNWDAKTFLYKGERDNMDRNILDSNISTIDKLIRIYPRQLGTYEVISSASDFKKYINDGKRHHLIISTQYIKKCKQFNIALYDRYSKIEPNENIDIRDIHNSYIQQKNRPLLFSNISIESLFYKNDFEMGIYTFNNDNLSDTDYLNTIRNQIDNIYIPIETKYIDSDIDGINRYDLNENIIYNKNYIVTGENLQITTNESEEGFWIIKVDDLDTNILDINENESVLIKINKIGTNMDKLGFPSYNVIRKWDKSIVYNVKNLLGEFYDTENNSNNKNIKIENMVSGITTISKIVRSMYDVPNIALSYSANIDIADKNVIPDFTDVTNFHSLIIAIQDDLLNSNTQERNYQLSNSKLHNSDSIKKAIYNRLLTDIIYVDQKKLGYNYKNKNTQFFRKSYHELNNDEYISNDEYIYNGNIIDSVRHNRDIIYRYTKFLLFAYHIENISELKDKQKIEADIDNLSTMLTHISVNPINIDPEIEIPDISTNKDITTENIRFTLNNINYNSSIPYNDDTIIENIDNIYRNPLHSETSYIENEYIHAGKRYDNNNNLYDSVFKDGKGTCINREIEFYHVINTLDLTFYDNHITETVYSHLLETIENEYEYEENYKNTYSFRLTEEYLNKFYKNIALFSINVNINKIIKNILKLIEKGFLALLTKYNKHIFMVLSNNTYNDSEIEPQIINSNEAYNTYIDYDANYIKEYMGNDKNPLLMRNKYYNGIDIKSRLCITYIFTQNFNSLDESTYNVKSKLRILNYRNKKETDNILIDSTFKDRFSDNIDNQINKNDNELSNIINFQSQLNNYINYEYWRDFGYFMKNNILPVLVYDLKDGYSINETDIGNDFSDISYNKNTFVLNHSPDVVVWYYGDKIQFIIEKIFEKDKLTYEYPPELIQYDDIPISEVNNFEDTLITDNINPVNKGYLYKGISNDNTGEILTLRFMGTDVRLNPECQIHGKIRDLPNSNELFKLFDYFIVRNNIPGERIDPIPINDLDIRKQCPLCFKTYCYMVLFNNNIRSTLFNNDNNKTHINDNDKINDAINDSNDKNKIIFLARPEDIQYDDVTQTYFHTTLEFTIYRIITILFRYSRMINNIILMNSNEFDNFKTNMSNNVNNIEFYNTYIDYLTELRNNSLYDKLQEQLKNLIKIIGIIKTDTNYNTALNQYNNISIYTPSKYSSPNYELYNKGLSFISSEYNSTIYEEYIMIKNIKYNEPEATLTRHQLYRGNIIIWILIQQKIVETYNNYCNDILNPVVANLNIDISTEIYSILVSILPDNSSYTQNIIDYYRLSQNNYNITNNFDNTITKMLTTCREFMIYYTMILYRYKSMSNLLSFSKIDLDVYQYYYNFTSNIFEAYFDEIKENITNYELIDINQYNNEDINNYFYSSDTSRYYYINKSAFSKNTNIDISGDEYKLFDYNNNYDIRQVMTINQYNNLLRILGIHKEYILDETIKKVFINYNNEFERYTTFIDNDIPDNTHLYDYEETIITYENNLVKIEKQTINRPYINTGIFNYIWYNYPTISTFLYDTFYRSSLLKVSDVKDNTDFNNDIISDRLYTNSLFTSPYIYIRDRLVFSPINRFGHTAYVKEWEYDMYSNVDTNTERLYEMRGVYVTYQYLFGDYKYVDIRTKYRQIYNYIFVDKSTSLTENINIYTNIINGLINDLVRYVKKVPSHELSILISQAITKYTPKIRNWGESLRSDIDLYEKELEFNFFGGITANQQFKVILKDINILVRTTIREIFPHFTALVLNSVVETIIDNIKIGKTGDDITMILNNIISDINTYMVELNTIFTTVDSKLAVLETTAFAKTNTDNRRYTPPQLYAMRTIPYFNNFEYYTDGLSLIASAVISLVSPKSEETQISTIDNTNSIYIDEDTGVNIVDINLTFGIIPILLSINSNTREYIYIKSKQSYIDSSELTLNNMNNIAYLDRYISSNNKVYSSFNRFEFINTIANRDISLKINNVSNYQEYKSRILKDNKISRRDKSTEYVKISTQPGILQFYIGTELHNNLVSLFNRKEPEHAWVRYLGYRMIENVSVIIDGEEIDSHNDDLLLLLHKMNDNIEHKRGIDRLIGHIEPIYKISKDKRPTIRLYIPFKFWFCKDYGNSLPLVNMLYSNIQIKIKLRKFDELFYMEKYAELKKPVKIKCHLIGNHIYLGDDERMKTATTRTHSLMERFSYSGSLIRSANNIETTITTANGKSKNILSVRYHFTDPCKYMIWKVSFDKKHNSDISKIYWDKSNLYTINNNNIVLKDIINKTLIRLNGKVRETWKDNNYFQILQPYNKQLNALDGGEFFYGFCLYPKNLQPSGTTNFTEIEDIRFLFEINNEVVNILKTKNININIKMWTCSYNIFMSASGFGALGFYGTE